MQERKWGVRWNFQILVLLLAVNLIACELTPEEQYRKHEAAELASGKRYDSLFMGLYFGMSRPDFRTYSFDQHLAKRFHQGGQRNSIWVEADIDDMEYPASINFYPEFREDTITGMNAAVYYRPEAKFKDGIFEKDSLLLDVLHLMEKWYGPGYFKIKSPFFYKEDVYVKINGNRRITIYPDQSGQMIDLWFVDLTALPKETEN